MSESTLATIIVALIAAMSGGLGVQIFRHFWGGKDKADAADVLTSAARSLIEPMNEKIFELEEKVSAYEIRIAGLEDERKLCREEMGKLEGKVKILAGQIERMGEKPLVD